MEELAAAEHAAKTIDTLSVTSPDSPTIVETLRRAYDQARRAMTPTLSMIGWVPVKPLHRVSECDCRCTENPCRNRIVKTQQNQGRKLFCVVWDRKIFLC